MKSTRPLEKLFGDLELFQEHLKRQELTFAQSQAQINRYLERIGISPERLKTLLEYPPFSHTKLPLLSEIYLRRPPDVTGTNPQTASIARAISPKAQRAKTRRWKASIGTKAAARRMERFINDKCTGNIKEFARRAKTTDKTLRKFRNTGRVKRSIFEDIARAMGITPEELLDS